MMTYRAARPLTALPSDAAYDVWLCDANGYRVALLNDYISMSYSLSIVDTGGVTLELPAAQAARVKTYALLEVWRRVGEREPVFVDAFVVINRPQGAGSKGTRFLTVSGPALTGYVVSDKRIVQASALPSAADVSVDTPGARTGALDDVLKRYVSDAMTEWDGNSQGRALSRALRLSVAANQGQAARRRVTASLTPLAGVARDAMAQSEQSSAAARKLYYRVRVTGFDPLTYVFETLIDRYGAYRGWDSPLPLIFSQAMGMAAQMDAEDDHSGEANSILVKYTAGGATYLTRITDAARSKAMPYAFREEMYSARATTALTAQAEAAYRLRAGEPRRMMRVTTMPTALVRYGVDYHLGDVVAVEALGERWDAVVTAVNVSAGPPEGVQVRLDREG